MINYIKTSSKELLDEFNSDLPGAEYWHKKTMGGDKKYEKKKQELLHLARKSQHDILGERVEWISKKGNRFCSQDIARYYGQGEVSISTFIYGYWETIGSIGAFMPFSHQFIEGMEGVFIFTDHFFLRYTDRMGIPERSKKVITDFMAENYGMTVYTDAEYQGKKEYIIQCAQGKCYGHPRKDDSHIIEVNTFLKDTMLTGKQKRESKPLNDFVRAMGKSEPLDVTLRKALKSGDYDGAREHIQKLYRGMGVALGKTVSESNHLADMIFQVSIISSIYCIVEPTDTELIMSKNGEVLELMEKYVETGRTKEGGEINPLDLDILIWKYAQIMGKTYQRGTVLKEMLELQTKNHPTHPAVIEWNNWYAGVKDWDEIWESQDF